MIINKFCLGDFDHRKSTWSLVKIFQQFHRLFGFFPELNLSRALILQVWQSAGKFDVNTEHTKQTNTSIYKLSKFRGSASAIFGMKADTVTFWFVTQHQDIISVFSLLSVYWYREFFSITLAFGKVYCPTCIVNNM